MSAQAMAPDAAQELIDAMTELAAVLLRESELLRRMRVSETAALKPEKERLVERYATLSLALRRDPQVVKRLPAARRATLAAAAKRFAEITQANQNAVKGAHDANEILFRTVAQVLGASDPTPYGRAGRATTPRPGAGVRPVSLNARL